MREIVLDTETTGLEHEQGHRIIEIGAVELNGHIPTGRHYHVYINPERDIDARASEVHGMTYEMLKDKPVFADIVDEFLAFIADATLVIHNADFDMGFLNAELANIGRAALTKNKIVDTLAIARRKFPGAPASLDALCRRFGVDNSSRDKHGALLDSELLAEVYLELMGGKQPGLVFQANQSSDADGRSGATQQRHPQPRRATPLPGRISDQEKEAHGLFLDQLPVSAMWRH